MKPTRKINIFISYSWSDKDIADQIEKDLTLMGISITRDVRDVAYKQSLSKFMETIRDADFALILISDQYLKSRNCMNEVLHLLKERDYEEKLLPVKIGKLNFYDPLSRLEYTKYWKFEKDKLGQAIGEVSQTAALSSLKDLQIIEIIHSEINEFLGYITDIKHLSFEDLRTEGYKSIFDVIGFNDITHLFELLMITLIVNPEEKEIRLEDWFSKYTPTSDAYSIRAGIARDKKEFIRAKTNYKKALEIDNNNAYTLNNYGFMLQGLKEDPQEIKELYERAIAAMPNLTEPRLNLGCLLTDKFNDLNGAKIQYEKVIELNPSEEKAYNNLANIIRSYKPFSPSTIQKTKELFEQALKLNPNYDAAHFNYGSYLCEFVGDYDLAEYHLKEALRINEHTKPLVDIFMKRLSEGRSRGKRIFDMGKPCPCGSGIVYESCCFENS